MSENLQKWLYVIDEIFILNIKPFAGDLFLAINLTLFDDLV